MISKIKTFYFLLFITNLFFINNLTSQVTSDTVLTLTLDEYFSGKFSQEISPVLYWINDGEDYLMTKTSSLVKGGRDIIKVKTIDKEDSEIFVNANQLIYKNEKGNDTIKSFSFKVSDGLDKVLIFTNTKRVWRLNTRGDYYILERSTGKLVKLGKGLPESSLMFAKISPDGKSVVYVSGNNLYLEDIKSSEIKKLTEDGTKTIINGTFDWVYEEEFGCRDGFRWSPDGKYISYWQIDASKIPFFNMINNTDSVYSRIIPVEYPKAGVDPSSCKIFCLELETGKKTKLNIPGDEIQNYLPRMQWVEVKNKNEILVTQLNRKQNELKLWICNPETGNAKQIYSETDKAYIELDSRDEVFHSSMSEYKLTTDKKSILFLSEKDGWRHIYKINLENGNVQQLTKGKFDVGAYYNYDEVNTSIYFNMPTIGEGFEDSRDRYLWKVIDRNIGTEGGELVMLTPEYRYGGYNTYNVSPNGKYAVHTFSNTNSPPISEMVRLPDHRVLYNFTTNEKLKNIVSEFEIPKWEKITVITEDGISIDGQILKPKNFDSTKKYPVFLTVYGEPGAQTAINRWSFGLDNVVNEMGFIVVTFDGRGSAAPKGSEFRKSIYKQNGKINSRDQAMAMKELLKLDYIDKERINVYGWSGGGTMTLNLLFRYPEIFKTGISVAPVTHHLFYDNIYTERYMGLPQENFQEYLENSPSSYAKNLEGNLFLIHGTGDDNVHYQNTEFLINELIKYNKKFRMMTYPNRSHGISEGKGTTRHLYESIIDYLKEKNQL